jgi:hypothetical protein
MVIYQMSTNAITYFPSPILQMDVTDEDEEEALQTASFFCQGASVIANIAALTCYRENKTRLTTLIGDESQDRRQ